jgi:phosphonate transport system ATP-binding protein
VIIVRNLSKEYPPDHQILSQVSFQVDEGEFIVVVGGSGSGKSTLLRCISHKEKWTSGQLIVDGKDLTKPSWLDRWKLGKSFAYLAEKPYLNLNKSALKNVLQGRFYQTPIWRFLTGAVGRDEHILGMDYLEKVGLLDKGHKKISGLSGGEQQRVAIAKALVHGARFLVADEPIAGLDPKSVDYVLNDLKQLVKEQKITVICTLNQLELIWGLAEGRIVLDIPARSLTLREKHLIFGGP